MKPSEQLNLIGVGITILIIVALSFFVDIGSLKIWVEKAGVWGPLIFILLKTSTIVIAPLSGSPLYPTVGLIFGFWPGILYVMIGDLIGYSANFYISRILGRDRVAKWLSGKEENLIGKIINHVSGTKGFFHACITCFAFPELLSYAAGLSRLSFIKFVLIAPPFLFIPSFILVFFGSVLDPESQTFLITLTLPIMGALGMIGGGFLFSRELAKERKR